MSAKQWGPAIVFRRLWEELRIQSTLARCLSATEGFPIAHEVFPGDTGELETFREALRMVKERFNIGRVILVADRGMVSEDLLGQIKRAGLEYIVGVKMRKLKAAREVLARAGRYHVVSDSLQVKEVTVEGA